MSERRFTVDPERLRAVLDDGEMANASLKAISDELEVIRDEAAQMEMAAARSLESARIKEPNRQTAARLDALKAKRAHILERREQAAAELMPRIALARRVADYCRRSHQSEVQAYGF
jgi:hypothetical protein